MFRNQGCGPAIPNQGVVTNPGKFVCVAGRGDRDWVGAHQFPRKLMQIREKGLSPTPKQLKTASPEKYSITLIVMPCVSRLHIDQPQREGDGRQALVVPPLYPAPATSLKPILLRSPNTLNLRDLSLRTARPVRLALSHYSFSEELRRRARLYDHALEDVEDQRESRRATAT